MKINKRLIIIISSLIYVFVCFYFSPYVRGSDQYWYTEEVQSLNTHHAVTNNIFPASLPESDKDLPRPWVQNRPAIYLVYLCYLFIRNIQFSWVFFNCICLFISAFLVAKLLFKNIDDNRFVYCYIVFLLFPLNFYLCLQPLVELFNMLLVTILMYLLLHKPLKFLSVLWISIFTGLLIWERENYFLLLLFIPLLLIDRKVKATWTFLIPFFVVTLAMVFLKPKLFPSHTIKNISIMNNVLKVTPTGSNMINYTDTTTPHFTVAEAGKRIINKVAIGLSEQVKYGGSSSVFFYLIDIILIPFILLLFKTKMKEKRIWVITVFILVHFITISVAQNEYRYAAAIIPALFLADYWYFNERDHKSSSFRLANAVLAVLFALFCFGLIGRQNRKEAIAERNHVNAMTPYKAEIGSTPILVGFDGGKNIETSYVFYPNTIFYFPTDYTEQQIFAICKRFKTNFCIVRNTSITYRNLTKDIISSEKLPGSDNLYLLRLSVPV